MQVSFFLLLAVVIGTCQGQPPPPLTRNINIYRECGDRDEFVVPDRDDTRLRCTSIVPRFREVATLGHLRPFLQNILINATVQGHWNACNQGDIILEADESSLQDFLDLIGLPSPQSGPFLNTTRSRQPTPDELRQNIRYRIEYHVTLQPARHHTVVITILNPLW